MALVKKRIPDFLGLIFIGLIVVTLVRPSSVGPAAIREIGNGLASLIKTAVAP